MKAFGNSLRQHRVSRGITLDQIAEATMINIRFLEAIEEGNMDMLPRAYVRAFLREYAAVVALDASDVLLRYEAALPAVQPEPAQESRTPVQSERQRPFPAVLLESKVGWAAIILFALAGFAAVIGLLSGGRQPPTEELPFQDAVREQEERLGAEVAAEALQAAPPRAIRRDSLLLNATITDSLWLQIVIDDSQPLEYLFGPNRRASWRAAERFLLTLGNGGAAEFVLNGTRLGALGRPGTVVRNAEISRERLRKE
jgi:cytoskeletal protein RodZ